MKSIFFIKLLRTSFLYITLGILLSECASVQPPPGGPKDEDPPILMNTFPILGSTNFKGRVIKLEFNEAVKLDNIFRQLIIAPYSDVRYSTNIKKDIITLEFDEDFEENTTYLLNFRESVIDITEKNIAQNVKVAFSTGDFIDSLKIEGNVSELLTGKAVENATVMLLREEDTLNVQKPTYLTKTDEKGNYSLEYLQNGTYQIYAILEEDNNLSYSGEDGELFGFKAENIVLDSSIIDFNFQLAQYDIEDIFFKRAGVEAQYAEFEYNKNIERYEFDLLDEGMKDSIFHIINENKIKIYKLALPVPDSVKNKPKEEKRKERRRPTPADQVEEVADSLLAIVTVYDLLEQSSTDTIKFAFSKRRQVIPEGLSTEIEPKSGKKMIPNKAFDIEILFNKPALKFDESKINLLNTRDTTLYNLDTLFSIIRSDTLEVRTDSTLLKPIELAKNDTIIPSDTLELLYNSKLKFDHKIVGGQIGILIQPKDITKKKQISQISLTPEVVTYKVNTLDQTNYSFDTTFYDTKVVDTLPNPYKLEITPNYSKIILKDFLPAANQEILLDSLSFLSVEYDTLKGKTTKYTLKDIDDYGSVEGRVETNFTHFFVQLLNDRFEIEQEIANARNFRFDYVEPGKKYLRLQVDNNKDGKWDQGNFMKKRPAEDVFFGNKEGIDVKANWEILGEVISTNKP